jgi:hypothetical protein
MAIRGEKRRGYIMCLLTVLPFIAMVSSSSALNSEANRATLKGLVGVRVLVEEVAPEIEKSGLTKNKLEADVEATLKKAGIKVLTQEEVLKTPGEPYLYVNINAAAGKMQSNLYSYSIDIALIQNVVLERDPKAYTYAITWSTGGVGLTEKESLNQLGESLLNIVDVFIEAHQSVNKSKK